MMMPENKTSYNWKINRFGKKIIHTHFDLVFPQILQRIVWRERLFCDKNIVRGFHAHIDSTIQPQYSRFPI